MKWLDKWISKKVKQAWDEANKPSRDYEAEAYNSMKISTIGGGPKSAINPSLRSNGMSFTVYQANGGHVLEYQYYDPKTDHHTNSLHLVPAEQDLGQTIGHAITLEMLKR